VFEALGSFVGRAHTARENKSQAGYAFGASKLRANLIGRDFSFLQCSKLIERVAGRFVLPKTIVRNAVQTAKRLLLGRRTYRATMPAISAYSLLHACRSAEITRVGLDDLLEAFSEAGRRVSLSQILRIGRESPLPLPAIRPEELARRAVVKLQSDARIVDQIRKANLDEVGYFASLLEATRKITKKAGELGGFSPRTVAAASVYLAGRQLGQKVITQREAAESLEIAEYTVREFCSRFTRSSEAR
jgi:transcription initiation factor TFIIIB Brf1 subunit/transcription initiation factor TFIIB